jgi:putative membrane protein
VNERTVSRDNGPGSSAPKAAVPAERHATEYLAAERTFLAWMRTCISIIGLGFVIAKFGVWLEELARRLDPNANIHGTGLSLAIGVAIMAVGGALSILALAHYHLVNKAIEQGEVRASRGLVATVAIAVAASAVLVIIYLLLTTRT